MGKKECIPYKHVTSRGRCYPDQRAPKRDGIVGTWINWKYKDGIVASEDPGYVVAVRQTEPGILIVGLDWESSYEPWIRDIPSTSMAGPATSYGSLELPNTIYDLARALGKMNDMIVDMSGLDKLPEIRRRWIGSDEHLSAIEYSLRNMG